MVNLHELPYNPSKTSVKSFGECMRAAAITSVRNDKIFLDRWIEYYGTALGPEHLYVFLDGFDQPLPEAHRDINVIRMPHIPKDRVTAMRRRARLVSDLARGLHRFYDCVIGLDVDEFLIPDPEEYNGLRAFLEQNSVKNRTISGLGLDVGQKIGTELELDLSAPFLGQRRFAHISTRYTKPAISFKPVTWGSGFHRVKGRNFSIHPHLFLFHTGMIDFNLATGKTLDQDRLATGWKDHLSRRTRLFEIISETKAGDFDTQTRYARRMQTYLRPIYAWNKPMMLGQPKVVEIPSRFHGIL